MKIHVTASDVEKAIDYANQRPLLGQSQQHRDIAAHLNQTLALRYGKRWHGVGCILEVTGALACLTGLMLAITEEHLILTGVIGTILGFIIGLVGWALTDNGGDDG
jgi:hypothetical protein